MKRIGVLVFLSAALLSARAQGPPPFELDELTVAQLQDAMRSGRSTSRRLVELYAARIEQIDRSGPALRSVLETNPDALSIAAALDAEREAGRVRGPLHGIPPCPPGLYRVFRSAFRSSVAHGANRG